jgi:GT2 family glycosyltransferase
MSRSRRMKETFRESLPPSLKFRLKRAGVGAVHAVVRLAARAYNFADRVLLSARTHGLDLQKAWDVRGRPQAPPIQPWGASDFLFMLKAASGVERARGVADRNIRTSIIIPVYNKADFTFHCLRSLMREVEFAETEVIVVNNASTDETKELLSHFRDFVRVIENEENLGFVDARNQGAAAARGRYLVFLDNDTIVQPGWLEALLESVGEDASVGAVGSLSLYPNGRIQEAGAIVWKSGETFHYGRGNSPDDRRFKFAREVDYCSGASLLVRRELFEQLGGFDRRSAPAYYEDADLCFGVRALGYKVVYQPASRIVHYEGATAGTDTHAGFKRYQLDNRAKFYEKWREVLEREHYPNDARLAERASNRKSGPYVLVIDDCLPTPDRDAGSARMVFILRALAEWSRPVFVYLSKHEWHEYERQLWRAGVETVRAVNLRRLFRERKFCVAILSRPHVAEALMQEVRRADPNIKLVFDMVDAHFIRLGREHELTGDARASEEAERFRRVETRIARASDLIWCTSPADMDAVRVEAPGVPIEIIPTIHRLHGRGKPFGERSGLLFLGNMSHRPNTDAVHFYMREILPSVREAIPEAELLIVGDNAPPEVEAYALEVGVRLLGYVPDIDPLFASCRLLVAPLRFGAGVKGKIGEALAYGLPVVTTGIGAEGMGFTNGVEALIADDPREFASQVVRAYRDAELWQRLSDNGHAHIARHLTPEVVGRVINEPLRKLCGETSDGV